MKYKLKKDLPFADKGSFVWIEKVNSTDYSEISLEKHSCSFYPHTLVRRDLINDWVEEVKPREFYIQLKKRMSNEWVCNDVSEHTLPSSDIHQVIKVREVLE